MKKKEIVLKKLLDKSIFRIGICGVILIAIVTFFVQTQILKNEFRNEANTQISDLIERIEQNEIIQKEQIELEVARIVEAVAAIIGFEPEILREQNVLNEMLKRDGLQEISVFDSQGVCIATTGEHISGYNIKQLYDGYFAPLFQTEKKMIYIQEQQDEMGINTESGAIWDDKHENIVLVSRENAATIKELSNDTLSKMLIFLNVKFGQDILVVDKHTGVTIGDTRRHIPGEVADEFELFDVNNGVIKKELGSFTKNKLEYQYYCRGYGEKIICIIMSRYVLYNDLLINIFYACFIVCIMGALIRYLVIYIIMKKIVTPIEDTSKILNDISRGKMKLRIPNSHIYELNMLADHINVMVDSVVSRTNQISYIFNEAQIPLAIFEINHKINQIQFTGDIGSILELDEKEVKALEMSYNFDKLISKITDYPLEGEEKTYRYINNPKKFITINKYYDGGKTWGVILDNTKAITKKLKIQREYDLDHLTGTLSRRTLYSKLSNLFTTGEIGQYFAIMMIDLDNLKSVNDNMGHNYGDQYIIEGANTLHRCNAPNKLVSRLGGDEFVLVIYNENKPENIRKYIEDLQNMVSSVYIIGKNGEKVPVGMSCGYVIESKAVEDYQKLLDQADVAMYNGKHKGKGQFIEYIPSMKQEK